jgi:hypothetical protein
MSVKILEEQLARFIRLLDSNQDGEVLAAVQALKRVLASHGTDLNGLAGAVEKLGQIGNGGALSREEIEKLYRAGYVKGVEDAEIKLHGGGDFRSADGKPQWDAVALFLQHNKSHLAAKHHEFIDSMAARTAWGREPTDRQHKYLFSLFFELGGRITP